MTRIGSACCARFACGCGLLLALLLTACGGSNSGGNFVRTTGFFRAVNAIPDSPTLSVGIVGVTGARVSFAQASTLNPVNSGNYAFNATYATSAVTSVDVITGLAVPVRPDEQTSVFIMGPLATPTTKLVVNPLSEIAAGEAEFQVVHAATGQTTLDVYVTDAAAPLTGATPITIAYEGASDLFTVPAGANYRLRVTPPGDSATILYDSGTFPIDSLARTSFVLVDYFGPGGNGFRAVQLTNLSAATFPNEALPGALRVANMIANQTAVDVYVGGAAAPSFGNVPFGEIGVRQQFAAGSLAVTVTPPATPGTVLFSGTVTLNPGESRTLAFAFNGTEVVGRFALDSTRPISVQPQLQTVQASPSSGNVDVYLLSAGETVDTVGADLTNLPLLSVTSATPPAGSYDVDVTPSDQKTVVTGPVPILLEDGGIYTMYLTDAPGGGLPAQIILGDDFN